MFTLTPTPEGYLVNAEGTTVTGMIYQEGPVWFVWGSGFSFHTLNGAAEWFVDHTVN